MGRLPDAANSATPARRPPGYWAGFCGISGAKRGWSGAVCVCGSGRCRLRLCRGNGRLVRRAVKRRVAAAVGPPVPRSPRCGPWSCWVVGMLALAGGIATKRSLRDWRETAQFRGELNLALGWARASVAALLRPDSNDITCRLEWTTPRLPARAPAAADDSFCGLFEQAAKSRPRAEIDSTAPSAGVLSPPACNHSLARCHSTRMTI